MSKKEDAAFKEWAQGLVEEVEDNEVEALNAWLALPVAREVFRGTVGQAELYRRMNEIKAKNDELDAKEEQLNHWYEENAPVVEAVAKERDELKAQLAALGSGGPPPAEGTGVNISKDELAKLQAETSKIGVIDKLLPSVLTDVARITRDSIKNDFDIDPGEVIQQAIKRGVQPWRAYLELTGPEREKRAEASREEEKKKWFEEGRRSAATNSPDHFQPSGPSVVDFLQSLNKTVEQGGKTAPTQSERTAAALQMLREGNFSE